jgi:photosystem I subunit II
MALSAQLSKSAVSGRADVCRKAVSGRTVVARPARSVNFRVRAEAATEAAVEEKVFTPPALNPDTPSPIFGGSTGGLLKKAQV